MKTWMSRWTIGVAMVMAVTLQPPVLAQHVAAPQTPPQTAQPAHPKGSAVTSPDVAIALLKEGNARFYSGSAIHPSLTADQRRAQTGSQTPFATILACSDSRVPVEIVFDQGLGSLFTVRVAGNIVEEATAGSVEYAIEHLGTQTVVVMGHEGCGAVAAAMLDERDRAAEPENVRRILDHILASVADMPPIRDAKARMREAVVANVRLQVDHMRKNQTVAAALREGRVRVIGAFYEIGSGAVDFLETDDELRLTDAPTD